MLNRVLSLGLYAWVKYMPSSRVEHVDGLGKLGLSKIVWIDMRRGRGVQPPI